MKQTAIFHAHSAKQGQRAHRADIVEHLFQHAPVVAYLLTYLGLPVCLIASVAVVTYGAMLPLSLLLGWL